MEHWHRMERVDAVLAQKIDRACESARAALHGFFQTDSSGYVGVSWGKDSVVVAHLVASLRLSVPVVWVKIWPLYNPDCERVRDKFLAEHDIDYREIEVDWWPEQRAAWAKHARTGSCHSLGLSPERSAALQGFDLACDRFGDRHVSGVRAEESGVRRLRMKTWGHSSPRTCAPIGWWSTAQVFAYLHRYDLPVHPAYAMTFGGTLERDRMRVDAFGGGKGGNRAEWEGRYYGDRIHMICEIAEPPVSVPQEDV
jgi:phosphoadenosine phosphosulfate reductase